MFARTHRDQLPRHMFSQMCKYDMQLWLSLPRAAAREFMAGGGGTASLAALALAGHGGGSWGTLSPESGPGQQPAGSSAHSEAGSDEQDGG